MSRILITGFAPFDGRSCNASWIAAQSLLQSDEAGTAQVSASAHELRTELLPVCWGAPHERLAPLVRDWNPDCIISMGEGQQGFFRIETRARNVRRERADNDGLLPAGQLIEPMGPAQRCASADCARLCDELTRKGIPVRLSEDAGAFLCEELLYTLEGFKQQQPALATVLFVHVPPYGTLLHYKGVSRLCDDILLADFAQELLSAVLQLCEPAA